ncbi:hypothetical protein B7463_g9105, partial [Scytalidium lignicola]
MDSKDYKPFLDRAANFLDFTIPPEPYHVRFYSPAVKVLETGPVVELVTFWFPAGTTDTEIEKMQKKAINGFRKGDGGPLSSRRMGSLP